METASLARPGHHATPLLAIFALVAIAHGALARPAYAQADTWSAPAPLPTPRRLLAAAVEKLAVDGKERAIYTFGGCGSPCFDPPLHTSTFEETRVEVYEARSNSWSVRKPIPAILYGASAAAPGDGKIYLFGGFVTGGEAYAYDPITDGWSRKAAMPTPRHGLAAVALEEEKKVYVLGGSNGSAATGALEVYNPARNSWTRKAPMPTPRVFFAAAALNGRIYAIGGSPDCCGKGRTAAVEVYDPKTDRWSSAAPLPVALQVSAAAAVNGKIYVFGGFIPGEGVQGSTFEYDPAADAWTFKAPMPDPRDQAPAVVLEGIAHVVGGSVDCHCHARGSHGGYTPEDASLAIEKTSLPAGPLSPGGTVRYTIKVSNPGSTVVSGAAVTDDLKATGLQDVLWCRGSGCTPSKQGDLADTVALAANESVTYEITGTVPCSCGQTRIVNTACVQAPGQSARCATDTDLIRPAPGGHLAVTLTGPADLTDCDVLPYTVSVTNPGPGIACGAVLRIQPPPGSEMVSISTPCTSLPCGLGNLAPGSEVKLTAKFRVPAGLRCAATLSTTASVNGCANAASLFATKVPCVLAVTKSDGLDEAAPGDLILYTIGIQNLGCAAVSGAGVVDFFPAELRGAQWCRRAVCKPSQPAPLSDTLDLPPAGKETYQAAGFVLPVPPGSILRNTVTVSPPGSPPVSATDETRIVPAPPPALIPTLSTPGALAFVLLLFLFARARLRSKDRPL